MTAAASQVRLTEKCLGYVCRHPGDVGARGSREGHGVGGVLSEAQEEQPVARGGLLDVCTGNFFGTAPQGWAPFLGNSSCTQPSTLQHEGGALNQNGGTGLLQDSNGVELPLEEFIASNQNGYKALSSPSSMLLLNGAVAALLPSSCGRWWIAAGCRNNAVPGLSLTDLVWHHAKYRRAFKSVILVRLRTRKLGVGLRSQKQTCVTSGQLAGWTLCYIMGSIFPRSGA